MLQWKLVFHVSAFKDSLKARKPDLTRPFIDFKRKVSGPHARRAVSLEIQRWTSKDSYKESGGFFRSLFHIGREEMSDLGFLQFLIKVRHHPENIRFPHHSIDCTIGAGPLWRTA